MTDDIVTRLRIACRSKGAEYCDNCQPCDAANEIERLRKYIALLSLTVEMQTKELKELKNN